MVFVYGLFLVYLSYLQSYEATRTEDYWDSYSTGDILGDPEVTGNLYCKFWVSVLGRLRDLQ